MADSIPHRLGVFIRRHPYVPLAALVLLLLTLNLDLKPPVPPVPQAPPTPLQPTICTTQLAEQMVQAKQLSANKKVTEAYEALVRCGAAHAAGPDAATYLKIKAKWTELLDAQKRQAQQAERARKKSEGVRPGMSPEDVLASSWGKPQKINRTTRASGTHEQWVYSTGNYLYFDNDVLTAIQN